MTARAPTDVSIRRAAPADVAALEALARRSFAELGRDYYTAEQLDRAVTEIIGIIRNWLRKKVGRIHFTE